MNGKDHIYQASLQHQISTFFDILLKDCNELHEGFIFQDISIHYQQMLYYWDRRYQEVLQRLCPTCAIYFEIFRILEECFHLANPEHRWRPNI
jgi:hypothetical protein